MWKRPMCLLGVLAVAGATSACHDDNLGNHRCPVDYSKSWSMWGLDLRHTEPSNCPVFIPSPGTTLTTGGTVRDPGSRDFSTTRLLVRNADGAGLNTATTSFRQDVDGAWVAPVDVAYSAGTATYRPDRADFDLTFLSGSPGPNAVMTITYTNAVSASIGGPTAIQDPGTYTWTADVQTGVAPFTYRWYRDWELVGTDASFTDEGGGVDGFLLRLDVTDARGDAGSVSKNITVSHCSSTDLRC